jgi:hypothetical protein
MTDQFRAFISEDYFIKSGIRLMLIRRDRGKPEVFTHDNGWEKVEENVTIPENAGLVLPPELLEEIARAITKFLGKELPSVAEVTVLREVLSKEQERVDRTLFGSGFSSLIGRPAPHGDR